MFSLVIPCASDLDRLKDSLSLVLSYEKRKLIGEILICYNGVDLNEPVVNLKKKYASSLVKVLSTEKQGIGAGYKLGIQAAQQPFVVLSASDLPFGFTDIEAFLKEDDRENKIYIGSKGHRQSDLEGYSVVRRILSFCFYLYRVFLYGLKSPKDSQGSFILPSKMAKNLVVDDFSDEYLFTAELVGRALKKRIPIMELPIALRKSEYSSNINIFKDGFKVFWEGLKRK